MLGAAVLAGAFSSEARAMGRHATAPSLVGWLLSDAPSLRLPYPALGPNLAEDRDRDGVDDRAEHALAMYFRPLFVFDSRENARLPWEPIVLYQVHPRGGGQLEIKYAYLFRDDGGYAASTFCSDRHEGDNQNSSVFVTADPTGAVFTLSSVYTGDYQWPRDPVRFVLGSHPVIYLSAGKHHEYIDMSYDDESSRYSRWGCHEGMDGLGARVLARLEYPGAPHGWTNVGEAGVHPAGIFVNALDAFSFPGEFAWGESSFCGGQGGDCGDETSSLGSMWSR